MAFSICNCYQYYWRDRGLSTHNHARSLFKYYAEKTIRDKKHNIVDGKVSLSNPITFNDPFDVNCFFKDNHDMSGLFRILCMTKQYDEILMWSYYASTHTGFCMEYHMQDIVHAIKKLNCKGICITGDVKYTTTRPEQKSKLNDISITELKFYSRASFSKFKEWELEREIRFTVLSKDFENDEDDYMQIDYSIQQIYEGCNGKAVSITNSSNEVLPFIKLNKDQMKYEVHQ